MNRLSALFMACILFTAQAYADYGCSDWSCCDCCGFDSRLNFDVGGGYRNDSLKWRLQRESNQDIIQERWSNIGMGVVEANAVFLACEHFLVKADFDYGWFEKSGHQTYKAFSTEDSYDESLRARTSGNVYDISGGIGYQFSFPCYCVSLAPMVGYSYNYQKFKDNKYQDELLDDDDDSQSVSYHNKYVYRWNGPWVGAAFAYQPCCDILVFFDYAFHWSRLSATINEHFLLDQEPAHLRVSQAYGNEFVVGANYLFCDGWWLGAKFNYKNFWGNKGRYHTEHDEDKASVRKLTWVSYNITLDIGYEF